MKAEISIFDALALTVAFGLWGGLVALRPTLIRPVCAENPSSCSAQSVPAIDRWSIGLEDLVADSWSFKTQFLSGAQALVVPAAWNLATAVAGAVAPAAFFATVGADTVLLLHTLAWNGVAMETTRLLTQRPRPFVYKAPGPLGGTPAHYTSFYSGHTSATSAMAMCLVLTLIARGAPRRWWIPAATLGGLLAVATGALRILGGRHFLTDVLAGLVAGSSVAIAVRWLQARRTRTRALQPTDA